MSLRKRIHISPWMTIGTSLVLMAVVIFLGAVNYNRDKEQMGSLLKEKGAALIRSFEAGTRTGMMGMMGEMGAFANEIHLQILLEETAGQPDISYISIIDQYGKILAHNKKTLIGETFVVPIILNKLSPSNDPQWRLVGKAGKGKYFEVYKTFLPIIDHPGHQHQDWKQALATKKILDPSNRPYIFIGMNVAPFETAMQEDLKHNIVMAAIIISLGIAGVVSLFWAQNYTRSRQLLQDTQKIATEVVTNLPEGILVMDTRYRIIYSNSVAWHLLGTDESRGKNADAKKLLPENIWEVYDAIKSGKTMVEKEICLLPKKERPVPVVVNAADIHGENGDYIGFMFVLKDLTEIRELELKNQRIEKMATVGNLAAGIAHEIRNPLSSIKGYVTYFGSLFETGSENRKAATLMAEEVDRVNRVISELLEFARPSDLKMQPIKIMDLLDHSIRVIAHEAEISGIKILKKVAPDLPELDVDPDRLTQVLLNLYINALQSMPKGGELEVGAHQVEANICIEVKDTGSGIPVNELSHIFDPYFTTKNDGTGLGLAIAHKIVENHNGSIGVKSTEGVGTQMSILLPVTSKKEKDL